MRAHCLISLLLGVSLSACALEGAPETAPSPTPRQQPLDPVPCIKGEHDAIRVKLAPSCAGCHGSGTSAPFFASPEAFESLIVRNPRFVIPGDPDGSELIKLLEGTGTGAFKQMPTAGEPYAKLPAAQQQITMSELRQWITDLTLTQASASPDPDAPTTRRLGAHEVMGSMLAQLGLDPEVDFYQGLSNNHDSPTRVLKGSMPLYSPTAAPGLHYGAQKTSTSQRWSALGGSDWLDRQAKNFEISPSYLQTITQLSQAWCSMAVKKPDNAALFKHTTPKATSAEASAELQQNIAYLHLRMLGLPATQEDTTKIYQEVFLAHEPKGADVAWVAVCSYFIRHPLWLSL
jgi:hypothetical protein